MDPAGSRLHHLHFLLATTYYSPFESFPPPQVGLESYKEWIQLVADFTISSLNSWQWASGSVYYLLGLWCAPITLVGVGFMQAWSAMGADSWQWVSGSVYYLRASGALLILLMMGLPCGFAVPHLRI